MNIKLRVASALFTASLLVASAGAQEGAIAPSRSTAARSPLGNGALVAPSSARSVSRYGRGGAVAPSRYASRPTRGYTSSAHVSNRGPRRVWIDGHYESVCRRVWVGATYDRVWVEPAYSFNTNVCGISVRVLLHEGYWKNVRVPGHYEDRYERVWRPGYWSTVSYGR